MTVLAVSLLHPPELLGNLDETAVEDDRVLQVVPLSLLYVRDGRHHRHVQPAARRHVGFLVRQRPAYIVVPHALAGVLVLLLEPKRVYELQELVAEKVQVLPVAVRLSVGPQAELRGSLVPSAELVDALDEILASRARQRRLLRHALLALRHPRAVRLEVPP